MIHCTVTIALVSKGLLFLSDFLVAMCCCGLRQGFVYTSIRARIPAGVCLVRVEAPAQRSRVAVGPLSAGTGATRACAQGADGAAGWSFRVAISIPRVVAGPGRVALGWPS